MNKIVIITNDMFPYNSANATLNKNLALGLIANNSNVEVHLLKGNSVDNFNRFPKNKNVIKGVEFIYSFFRLRPKKYLLKIIEGIFSPYLEVLLLLKMHKNIDSIIINTGYIYSYLPIILYAKLSKITIIKYSVDWYDKPSVVSNKIYLMKWYLFQAQIKIFDKLLDGIIPISNYLYQHYLSIGFNEEQLLLIPNFSIFRDYESTRENEKSEGFTFGFSGAAPLLNGVDDLLKAFSLVLQKHTNAKLIIVGDVAAGESQLPILKSIALDLEILENVSFIGRVSSQEVSLYLERMDVLILPRKKTKFADAGFPTKLGEYFNTGKPVILTKVGDFPYYFSDKEEVVFAEPDDIVSLSKSMVYLLENQNIGIEIGKKGLSWAKNNLDYKNNGKKVLEFLLKLKEQTRRKK